MSPEPTTKVVIVDAEKLATIKDCIAGHIGDGYDPSMAKVVADSIAEEIVQILSQKI